MIRSCQKSKEEGEYKEWTSRVYNFLPCSSISLVQRPMFFPELREKEIKAASKVTRGLKKRYASWRNLSNYKACVSRGISSHIDAISALKGELNSLELCAGSCAMSRALKRHGFSATTLDNDPKRLATSQLSLEELEDAIVNGQIGSHPDLNKDFSVIWTGPECRTWSRAQNGKAPTPYGLIHMTHDPPNAHIFLVGS